MGIVFKRDDLMRRAGANPVFYMQSSDSGVVTGHIISMLKDSHVTNDFLFLATYFKPMSEPDKLDTDYFEEHEWRIIGKKEWKPSDYQFIDFSCKTSPSKMSFRFNPEEVQLIVFPNAATRKMAMCDSALKLEFEAFAPQMIDLDSCNQF